MFHPCTRLWSFSSHTHLSMSGTWLLIIRSWQAERWISWVKMTRKVWRYVFALWGFLTSQYSFHHAYEAMRVSCLMLGSNADNPATIFKCTTLSTMQQHLQHCDDKLTALHTAPTLTTTQSFNDENATIGKLQHLGSLNFAWQHSQARISQTSMV